MAYDNSIPSYASMLDFQEVYLRAIALVWADEYEKEEKGEKSTYREDFCRNPMKFLQEKFAYNCPWNVDLYVRCPHDGRESIEPRWSKYYNEHCEWVPGDNWSDLKQADACLGKKYKSGHWKNLKQNTVVFGHPQKPDPAKYANSEALALAAYNDSGPGYLFTCC